MTGGPWHETVHLGVKRWRPQAVAAALAAALAALGLLTPGQAFAYCRTSYCGGANDQRCVPALPDDCNKPLFWPLPCVSYSIQKDGSERASYEQTRAILARAFEAWTTAACEGGGSPSVTLTERSPVECSEHEYNQQAGNANVILFRDKVWPYEGAGSTLALTTLTFNLDTGEIYDADMEINGTAPITTSDDISEVNNDLLSITTHEAGHFLGLAHSPVPEATMYVTYSPHTIELRSLAADDRAGICAIYPAGNTIPAGCDSTPRHGFSSLCNAEQEAAAAALDPADAADNGRCDCALPGAPTRSRGAWAALGLAALAARGRGRGRGVRA